MPRPAPRTRKWNAILTGPPIGPRALRISGQIETTSSNETPQLSRRGQQFGASMLSLDLSIVAPETGASVMGWKEVVHQLDDGDDYTNVEIYYAGQRLQSLDVKVAH